MLFKNEPVGRAYHMFRKHCKLRDTGTSILPIAQFDELMVTVVGLLKTEQSLKTVTVKNTSVHTGKNAEMTVAAQMTVATLKLKPTSWDGR